MSAFWNQTIPKIFSTRAETSAASVAAVKEEPVEDTPAAVATTTNNVFEKDGVRLNYSFCFYLRFTHADGSTDTNKVYVEDLLDMYKDVSLDILVREAIAIIKRDHEAPEAKNIKFKYEDKSGQVCVIQVPRELKYALKEFSNTESLKLLVSYVKLKPPPLAAVASVPASPATPKRGRPKKPIGPRKKPKNSSAVAQITPPVPVTPSSTPAPDTVASSVKIEPGTTAPLSGVAAKIFSAVAEFDALGMPDPQRAHVALLSGYGNCKSAGFLKALGLVKQKGYLDFPTRQTVRLSVLGKSAVPADINMPESNADMKHRLLEVVKSPKAGEIYNYLEDGKVHQRVDLGLATGYTNPKSAGFSKALSKLGGLGIIHYPDSSSVQLTDIAFPYGRPA